MLQLYLPIAEVSVNALLILGLGGVVGFLSGMFGVGGGFLITPLLLFIGVPPGVAVATGANQVVASSISGVLAQAVTLFVEPGSCPTRLRQPLQAGYEAAHCGRGPTKLPSASMRNLSRFSTSSRLSGQR